MAIKAFKEKAKYHPNTFDFFNFDKLDAFHHPEVLSVIYGDDWESVLIVNEEKAFLHSFSKQPIENTAWYDIEPFIGYNGFVVNTNNIDFIDSALKIYSGLCREEKIIAEIVRFNPLLQNHKLFEINNLISVFPSKEIIIVNCFTDEFRQLQEFNSRKREYIKSVNKNQYYQFDITDEPKQLELFLEIYYGFLDKINADKKWYFYKDFFERLKKSTFFRLAHVSFENNMASASIVIEHNLAAYYFLAASISPHPKNSNDLLISKISTNMGEKGISKLILGGGTDSSPDNSLLLYKKKFSKECHTFYMGKLVHNPEVFSRLCNEAVVKNPEIAKSNFFLKYRL